MSACTTQQTPCLLTLPSSRPFVGAAARCHKFSGTHHCRRRLLVAAKRNSSGTESSDAGDGSGGGAAGSLQRQHRREFLLRSVNLAVLAEVVGSDDGRTILNSVLGAYGLPKLKATPGYRYFDDIDEPYTFEYPASWVRRKNTLRQGLYISDFNTADKLSLEVFPVPARSSQTTLAEAAVLKLINPASEIGGDARLELPPASRIKTTELEIDGKTYTYIAFPSETITRSGYQVRRKNLAVAAVRRGSVYVLGCSARSDQFNAEKEQTFQHVVDSFRLLG